MQFFNKILNELNGLHFKQEYLCLTKEYLEQPLFAYIIISKRVIKDITNHHLFTGYSPLVFTFPFYKEIDLSNHGNIDIVFSDHQFQQNDIINEKDALARITLKKIHEQGLKNNRFYYYEGETASHRFISSFYQAIIQFQNRRYNKKPGNVYLPGNLLKQVQVAYSLPRIISLVTVNQNDLFNLFPTDLHGQINDENYIISLRHGGKAANQVEMTKRIIITEIDPACYKTVYSLGKNHMQPLKVKDQFPFSDSFSDLLQLPLPVSAVYYRELVLEQSFDHGIHRFFLFKIINKRLIVAKPATLAHIHNVYGTWRHNKGLPGNYLLR
jgi:hypothetical protein